MLSGEPAVAQRQARPGGHQSFCAARRLGTPPRFYNHLGEKRAYPANLCPLSCGVEFTGFGEDLGQPVGELIEAMSARTVRKRATEHLNNVLSEE